MKKLFNLFSAFAFILSTLWLISSCTKGGKACKDIECLNGGVCQDGTCFCPDGFGGTDCGTVVSAEDTAQLHYGNGLGWNHESDHSSTPVHVNSLFLGGAAPSPNAHDLGAYFPPVGNQGQAGTCVDWSVAYNAFTAMKAIDDGIDPTQPVNQGSPKALWCATPRNHKGQVADALEIMMKEGVADMALVPYNAATFNLALDEFSDCNAQGTIPLAWSAAAQQHHIANYRRVGNDINAIKKAISEGHPVMFGIKTYPNFSANGWLDANGVYSSTQGTFWDPDHPSGHAMVIQGYDDSKNAFRVRNSWGNTWNGDGTFWIDYNFLTSAELGAGDGFYIMLNDGHQVHLGVDMTSGGMDLVPWIYYDYGIPGGANRHGSVDVYNIGDVAVPSSERYHTYLMYVNAYDASDFGILYDYEITDTIPAGTGYCAPSGTLCRANITIPGGQSSSMGIEMAGGASGPDTISGLEHRYTMPNISGQYYILLFADPLNEVAEKNESNNVFYLGGHLPKTFTNGYSARPMGGQHQATSYKNGLEFFKNPLDPTKRNLEKMEFRTAVTRETLNAYSVGELYQTMKNAAASGVWDRKVAEYETRTKR